MRTGRPPTFGPKRPCSLGCPRPAHADEVCHPCYMRLRRRLARLGEQADPRQRFAQWELQREVVDEIVVERLVSGDYAGPTTVGEREAAVRRLWRDRRNDHEVSVVTGIPPQTVLGIRRRLGLAAVPLACAYLKPRKRTRRAKGKGR